MPPGAAWTARPIPWGGEFMPGGKIMANTWHGRFPYENHQPHGFRRTSPVKRFPPNGYGLFDAVGNVWEWTNSGWTQDHTEPEPAPSCCGPTVRHHPQRGRSAGDQRRIPPLRALLLPPLPPGRPAGACRPKHHQPPRFPLLPGCLSA